MTDKAYLRIVVTTSSIRKPFNFNTRCIFKVSHCVKSAQSWFLQLLGESLSRFLLDAERNVHFRSQAESFLFRWGGFRKGSSPFFFFFFFFFFFLMFYRSHVAHIYIYIYIYIYENPTFFSFTSGILFRWGGFPQRLFPLIFFFFFFFFFFLCFVGGAGPFFEAMDKEIWYLEISMIRSCQYVFIQLPNF